MKILVEGVDVTWIFLVGILMGIILGQGFTLFFQGINEWLRRKKKRR